MIAPLA